MKHYRIWLSLSVVGLLIAGCNVFPYVREPVVSMPSPTPLLELSPTESAIVPTSMVTPNIPESPEETEVPPAPFDPDESLFFLLQPGNPIYLPNFSHPDEGCDWMGIAGQVFGLDGIPMLDLTIIAGKATDEETGDLFTLTGLATAYGPGGYELVISDSPVDTDDLFWVQVLNQDEHPLSEPIFFTTYEDCGNNLVLMNFVAQETSSVEKSLATPTLSAYP